MRTNFSNYDAVALLERVENDLGISINTSGQGTAFNLPPSVGEGNISTYLFRDGLALFLFKATMHEDWEWEFDCQEDSPAFLLFSLSGEIQDDRKESTERFTLRPLETLLLVNPGGGHRSMIFKKGTPISLAVLRIDPKKYFTKKISSPNDLPLRMRSLLSFAGRDMMYLMPANRSTMLQMQVVKEIMDCQHEGLLRTCFIEAKARQFLAIVMQRMIEETKQETDIELPPADVYRIQQAKELLIQNLRDAPTIESLARQIGVNRQKLKQDFKRVFHKSIYQYLIGHRMETARQLMMEKRVTVMEVAEEVGYENQSHFSRRFKAHHGLLPSKFLATVWRNGQYN